MAKLNTRGLLIPVMISVMLVAVLAAAACTSPEPAPTQASAPAAPTSAPASTVAPSPDAGLANLEVRVTDAPSPAVTQILITVRDVEVNRASGDSEAGWVTVVAEPMTFDLIALAGVEELLGSSQIDPGRYGQVRLAIDVARVTVDGEEREAAVPSDVLRVVGGFDLVAGETTVLTLDFDAERSVVLRGRGDPLLKPTVKLLVRPGGRPADEAEIIGEASEGDDAPAPTAPSEPPTPVATADPSPASPPAATPGPAATAAPVPTPTATPDALVDFFLVIESPETLEVIVAEAALTVIGRTRIDAVVSVNDVFAEVDEEGRFRVPLELEEGPNIIEVVVSIGSGEELSEVLVVIYSP